MISISFLRLHKEMTQTQQKLKLFEVVEVHSERGNAYTSTAVILRCNPATVSYFVNYWNNFFLIINVKLASNIISPEPMILFAYFMMQKIVYLISLTYIRDDRLYAMSQNMFFYLFRLFGDLFHSNMNSIKLSLIWVK